MINNKAAHLHCKILSTGSTKHGLLLLLGWFCVITILFFFYLMQTNIVYKSIQFCCISLYIHPVCQISNMAVVSNTWICPYCTHIIFFFIVTTSQTLQFPCCFSSQCLLCWSWRMENSYSHKTQYTTILEYKKNKAMPRWENCVLDTLFRERLNTSNAQSTKRPFKDTHTICTPLIYHILNDQKHQN